LPYFILMKNNSIQLINLFRNNRENEALWKEIAILRQKHHHQQQIVNKLIHFLVHLVNPSNLGLKRIKPLMIDSYSSDILNDMSILQNFKIKLR